MTTVTIREATIADKDAIFDVHYAALQTFHEFYVVFFKMDLKDSMPIATERALNNPDIDFLVAEEGGSVVGFIRYKREPEVTPNTAKEEAPPVSLWDPKEHLAEMWARFNARQAEMDACRDKAIDGRAHYYVIHLMIHPDHQRKGIGGKLLTSITDKADAEGIPTMLVSSAEANGLYSKLGFESLGSWPLNNGHWAREIVKLERSLGMEDRENFVERFGALTEVEDCMIRNPRSSDER